MLNTNVDICNACSCTRYGNEPANTRDDNKCDEFKCAEATEAYYDRLAKECEEGMNADGRN